MRTPDFIRLSMRDVPLPWSERQRLYGWLVEADRAWFIGVIQARNSFTEAMKPVVYDILQAKILELGVDDFGAEMWDLRNELEADLAEQAEG